MTKPCTDGNYCDPQPFTPLQRETKTNSGQLEESDSQESENELEVKRASVASGRYESWKESEKDSSSSTVSVKGRPDGGRLLKSAASVDSEGSWSFVSQAKFTPMRGGKKRSSGREWTGETDQSKTAHECSPGPDGECECCCCCGCHRCPCQIRVKGGQPDREYSYKSSCFSPFNHDDQDNDECNEKLIGFGALMYGTGKLFAGAMDDQDE